MADAPPKKKSNLLLIVVFAAVILVMFDPNLRDATGDAVGVVMNPIIGFGGAFPVLTILIAGTLMVVATTAMRHFTTDHLEMAKTQAYMREFNRELMKARKENNTYRLKALTDKQPEVMKKQSEMSSAQLKTMPLTMLVVIPLFAWLASFLIDLDYKFYSAPWNPSVEMFGTTVFPHWILLYMSLSIPTGALAQKAMKYLAWRQRWHDRHPDVQE
ncbi:MAG: DUF106 domain-containing protein [Thermoplasmatota archaeon]